MNELNREEFAAAVSAAVDSVHHLYRELHRLISGIRDLVAETPDPLTFIAGTQSRSGRDPGRIVVRNDYALLFHPAVDDEIDFDEDEEEDSDELDDDEVDDGDPPRRKRKRFTIHGTDVFFAVRIAVHDSRRLDSFEPHLSYGVMADWSIGTEPPSADSQFDIAWHMVRRIPKAIVADVPAGSRVPTAATVRGTGRKKKSADRRITCALPQGVKAIPLFELDNAESLQSAVESMKDMIR